jgi:hypothetical protein
MSTVRTTANHPITECNCSICSRNGYMFIYPPDENISFTKGAMTDFRVRRQSAVLLHYYSNPPFEERT